VVESYSCALLPNNLLIHGRLFVTPRFVCFGSWGTTRLVLPMESIDFVERANTMVRRHQINRVYMILVCAPYVTYVAKPYHPSSYPEQTQRLTCVHV
jgi:hypothetical protein